MIWPALHHLLAFVLLLAYFAIHSILAADRVKTWCSARLGAASRYYRLFYNGLALVLLFVLLRWMASWPEDYLFKPKAWTTSIALLSLLLSAWLGLGSLLQYDLSEFAGIRQLQQKDTATKAYRLNTSGFNAIVRHPLYLGTIFLLLGLFLLFPKMQALLLLGQRAGLFAFWHLLGRKETAPGVWASLSGLC